MRHLRRKSLWLRWTAVIAVLGNVVLGHTPARGTAGPDDMFGAHLMCTGGAAQTQAPGGDHEPDGKSAHCILCSLLAGSVLAIDPVSAAIAFRSTCIFHLRRFDLTTLADHLSLGGIHCRAPPLSA